MRAGQKMTTKDGTEVCLFPFEYLYMSQDEGGDLSHQGTYNIDLVGWGSNGVILKCPFYAPCTLKCVDVWDSSSNNRVYQSVNQVYLANGRKDYLTIAFAHDDNPIHNIGDIISQGDLLGHTGTTGFVTGDHTHTCCGMGVYQGFTRRGTAIIDGQQVPLYDLTNRIHYWQATFVNDTVIVQGYNHPWLEYEGGVVPPTPTPDEKKRKNFPWVLYAEKLRT